MSLLLVGHRGALAEITENTVESFALAERLGVDEVETDVRLSADGQLFMLHDKTLDRVVAGETDRSLGPVADLPWARIAAAELHGGLRVPTLHQTYQATVGRIQLELKAPEALDPLVDFFAAAPDHAARTLLTSFSAPLLARAADLLPQIPRGIITFTWHEVADHPGGPDGLMDQTGSVRLHTGFDGLTAAAVEACRRSGWPVHVWPLRTRDDLREGLRIGAAGMTTDDPRTATDWLRELAVSDGPGPPGNDRASSSD